MIVTQTEIEQEKNQIIGRTRQLQDHVQEFCSAISEVEEVIAGLRVVANTCGGQIKTERIAEVANLEFNQNMIQSISEDVSSIAVSASQNRVDL